MKKRALNKDDKSPKADRWRTKVRQGRLSTIRNRNITIVDRIRRIPTLLTASQHISILRSWRFLRGDNTLAVQNACSCVFSPVLILSPVFPERGLTGENARANAVSRRALSPVLPKEGVNGGENARASVLRSEGVCSPVISCRYSSAISPVPTAYRSHRVFFLMKTPLCSCMYTPPQSKAVHP